VSTRAGKRRDNQVSGPEIACGRGDRRTPSV